MKRLQSMSPLEETKPIKSWKEVSRSRTENSKREISLIQDASDLVFNNTLIWVLSMIPSPVFSVWTFMSYLKDQEAESVLEEDAKAQLEPNTESANNRQWNGSRKNTTVPYIIDLYNLIIGIHEHKPK